MAALDIEYVKIEWTKNKTGSTRIQQEIILFEQRKYLKMGVKI